MALTKIADELYFRASELGFYLENFACTEITFAFSARNKTGKQQLQKEVFNLVSEYGCIESIKFTKNHVIVRFESGLGK